jgi:hypothetical protein
MTTAKTKIGLDSNAVGSSSGVQTEGVLRFLDQNCTIYSNSGELGGEEIAEGASESGGDLLVRLATNEVVDGEEYQEGDGSNLDNEVVLEWDNRLGNWAIVKKLIIQLRC